MKLVIALLIAVVFPLIALQANPLTPPLKFYENYPSLDGHPGHYPLISDVTFRAISDFVIDQSTQSFDPTLVKQGDIVYVNVWYLPWFEQYVHDQIKYPYILISCDVGRWLPDPGTISKLLYDPKLAAWFCKNILFSYHPKLFQIPMGQNIYLFNDSQIKDLIDLTKKRPFVKKHFLYMNHFPRSYGDRDKIVKLFEDVPYCFNRQRSNQPYSQVSRTAYYQDLADSRFVISPLGLEIDCVRTWEALVLDCIPIVEHTFVDDLYKDLPVIKVHKWEDVNQKVLEKKYEKLKHLKCDKAYFDYWHQLIRDVQRKIRSNNISFTRPEATQFNQQDLKDLTSILKKKKKRKVTITCKGFLTTLRPFQLANSLRNLKRLFLYDPWLKTNNLPILKQHVKTPSIFKTLNKISFLNSETDFINAIQSKTTDVVFLDLTYHRNSLLPDFNDLRHGLKKDVQDLYRILTPGTLLCGNTVHDEYVQEVLDQFVRENSVNIQKRGNFWFLIKS